MHLIIEYHTPANVDRNKEYLQCIKNNIESQLFKKIHVFTEEESSLPEDLCKHLTIHHIDKRQTFQNLIYYCNNYLRDEICIISNTDIYFDSTLNLINDGNTKNTLFCISRWDVLSNGELKFTSSPIVSQDCWVFKSPLPIKNTAFHLGTLGCDSKISFLAKEAGMQPINPSKMITIKHLHLTNYRTYTKENRLPKPYLSLPPVNSIQIKML